MFHKLVELDRLCNRIEVGLQCVSQLLWNPVRLRRTFVQEHGVPSEPQLQNVHDKSHAGRQFKGAIFNFKVFLGITFKKLRILLVKASQVRNLFEETLLSINLVLLLDFVVI